MKILYLDCSSGVSGNMLIGGLLNAGMDVEYLKKEIKKLHLSGYSFAFRKKLGGIYFNISLTKKQSVRKLSDIRQLINKSRLSPRIKRRSLATFAKLAEAESKVHGVPLNQVHFHELGAVDTIIDIVGCAIGLEYFGIAEVFSSPLNVGSGWIKTRHGLLPIPAPATAELLVGIPIYDSGIKKELVTPTGAAIVATLVKRFGPLPRLRVSSIGAGAGSYKLKEQPNLLRIYIGEKEFQAERDAILQIETNIDDMDPRYYDLAVAKLMKAGALDAYLLPLRMKKRRSAVQLIVLCMPDKKEEILEALFTYTTSLGTRIFLVEREKLKRKSFKTRYGRIKLGVLEGKPKSIALEPDDYSLLLKKHKFPTKSTYQNFLRFL